LDGFSAIAQTNGFSVFHKRVYLFHQKRKGRLMEAFRAYNRHIQETRSFFPERSGDHQVFGTITIHFFPEK